MKLIIDTNIFFSGLIKDSITRKLLLHPNLEFYIPDFFLSEFIKYQEYLLTKTKLEKDEFNRLQSKFLKRYI